MKTGVNLIRFFSIALLGMALSACSSVSVEDYAANRPRLVAEEFFDGKLLAQGIVKDRSGRVVRYFTASIDASWNDGIGTLDESFVFDDGEQQTRVWTLTPGVDNTYVASAGDVIGEGKMKVAGNSVFLDYVLRVPYNGDSIDLRIDDRMYLVSERVLLNESIMTKWGFKVGSIMLMIEKQ